MDEAATDVLPARVAWRPGLTLVRRDRDTVQLGLGADAVIVADGPQLRALQAAIRDCAAVPPAAHQLGLTLWSAGALVDADAWAADLIAQPRLAPGAYACRPTAGSAALARRRAAVVAVDCPAAWRPQVVRLLAASGLRVSDDDPHVTLVVSAGEVDRRGVDLLMQREQPHLLLRVAAASVSVGPFVAPGLTACLRCEDAHRTDADPRWPLLVAQLAAPLAAPLATPLAAPLATPRAAPLAVEPTSDCWSPEPALLTLALAWAVRDLGSFVEAERPASWSAVIDLDGRLETPRRALLRHPHCGCSWSELLATG